MVSPSRQGHRDSEGQDGDPALGHLGLELQHTSIASVITHMAVTQVVQCEATISVELRWLTQGSVCIARGKALQWS